MSNFPIQAGEFDYIFQFSPRTGNAIWGLNLGYTSGAASDFANTSNPQIISGESGVGNSVSLVPPYLFLANSDEEAVEVYHNPSLNSTGENIFKKTNRLTGNGFTGASGFGYIARGNGVGVAIGAPYSTAGSALNVGAAFVFARYITGGRGVTGVADWGQLTAFSGTQSGSFYGKSVDVIKSNTNILLAAGAPSENSGSGAVYVHNTSPSVLLKKLTPTGEDIQNFGKDIQFTEVDSIKYIISSYDHGGTGAIDIYKESSKGLNDYERSQTISPSGGSSGDMYGYEIAAADGSFLIGAPEIGGSGGVYYYRFDNDLGIFTESQKIYPAALGGGNAFGKSLAFDGDHAIATANEGSGRGYIYKLQGGLLEYISSVSGSLTSASGAFGGNTSGFRSAAINGNVIVIGENNDPINPNYNYYFTTGGVSVSAYTGISISGSGGKLFDSENNFIYGYSSSKETVISGGVFTGGYFTMFVNNNLCTSHSDRTAGSGYTGVINSWTMNGAETLSSYSLTILED